MNVFAHARAHCTQNLNVLWRGVRANVLARCTCHTLRTQLPVREHTHTHARVNRDRGENNNRNKLTQTHTHSPMLICHQYITLGDRG